MIELLDYVLDYNDNFWIVAYISDEVKGYMTYEVDENGNRYNNITHKMYTKKAYSGYKAIPKYKQIFKANKFYLDNKKKLTGVWKKYVKALNKIGIEDKDIGIFGSYMIGFDIIKDVDFIIYGKDNLKKYYDNNDFIKEYTNSTTINQKHIDYQYNRHKTYHHSKTSLYEIISRNWSGIQVNENVLSTPRFIDRDNQRIIPSTNERKTIHFEVIDGFESTMFPRRATIIYNNEEYTVETCLWKYQSFLRKGDIVECSCYLNDQLKKVVLPDEKTCYIEFIKKGKEISS